MNAAAEFAAAIKHDAGIDLWVELSLRAQPGINPQLSEEIRTRVGQDFRSHLIPTLEKHKRLTLAFGESLYVIDDPMEIMLILEARVAYRVLRAKLATDPPRDEEGGDA